MICIILLLKMMLKVSSTPCSSLVISPIDPIDSTLIQKNFIGQSISGFGMWHRWMPMLRPDLIKSTQDLKFLLFLELDNLKTQRFAIYILNQLDSKQFLAKLDLSGQFVTSNYFNLDNVIIEGNWAYIYYCQKQVGSTATYNYAFFYYLFVDQTNYQSYYMTGSDSSRGYSNQTFYSQTFYPGLGYTQYLGYKGELQFTTTYYNTKNEFLAAIEGTCSFPDFCPTGQITSMIMPNIVDYNQTASNFQIYYYESNYALSGWIKLRSTLDATNATAIRLALLPYYADDYSQGDRQMMLTYYQNYVNPESTQITINTFSFNYAGLTFYKTTEDDIWFVQGIQYEDEITKWHYFSFQHGQHVIDEIGYANTKIYFKFSSFEITDYFQEKKNHFTSQQSQLMLGKDKYSSKNLNGFLAFIKIDYCFGNIYTLVMDCHNLCKTCSGPESNSCTLCQTDQQRVLAESECLCKRNFNENIDPSNYACQDILTQLEVNIIQSVPYINQCNEGQFKIVYNGQTNCQYCPSIKGDAIMECAECQLYPQNWYLNPICSSDYKKVLQSSTGAFEQKVRPSYQQTLNTITDDLSLQPCYGCLTFITNTKGIANYVIRSHLGQKSIIQCKSCYKALNNECIIQTDNCESCDESFQCTECVENYQLVQNKYCQRCPEICSSCQVSVGNLVCATCPQNYYLSDGNCVQCGENCSVCDQTRCYKCTDTSQYYISLDGKNCYANTIANCQIAYEESIENPQIMSLQKNYTIITFQSQSIVKCAFCNPKTTNLLTSCQNDNSLLSDQRAIMNGTNKIVLQFTQIDQGKYVKVNDSSTGICDSTLNCRKCIEEDSTLQDSWKWDIQSFYEFLYSSSFFYDIQKSDSGKIKCLSCLPGYDFYDGICISQCPTNCKTCQYIDNKATCVECKINQNGQQLSLFNNTCILCPYNCALCKERSKDLIYSINPYFNPDYDEFLTFSYICLKSYQIPGVFLNFDFDLVNYIDCSDANSCQQIAIINQNLYCENQASYSNYDKYIGDLTIQKFEGKKVLRILNQKVVKKVTIKLKLIKGTGQCVFPQDFQIISKLRNNVFSLLELNLEFEGTQDVIFNSNFAISGFNNIIMKNFDVVSNSKPQQIHIYDSISYKISISNINLVVNDIQFEIQLENATSIDLNQFTIKDSSLINSNGIFSIFGYLITDDINFSIQQIILQNNQFINSTIFLFYMSQNYNNQNIQISQITLENNIYESRSYVFKTNYTVNVRKSQVSLTQITQNRDQFTASTFANFEGTLLVSIQQVYLIGCTFSSGSYWMILPLFKIKNLIIQGNYLISNDVTLISNKASVQYSDASKGNSVELKSISFESNQFIGNKAFIEIYQTTFLNIAVIVDQLILNQNSLQSLNKLSNKYIASENSTIYLDVNSLILTNTQITRSKTLPEIAVLNGISVKIVNLNVERNSVSLKLLSSSLSCVFTNIIPQVYTTIVYLYNIQNINIDQMSIIGVKSINQPLIQIKSLDTLKIRQKEIIAITNSYFAENLLILSKVSEIQAIISIISEQDQSIIISDSKFLYNYLHSYISDLSFVSSSTILFQNPNSTIILNRMNFEKNIATNGQNSNLVLKCNSIIIQTSSFLQSNQLEFRVVRQNIVWGLSENYIPRQEEYFQAFPIKTFGGSAFLSANTTKVIDVNVFGSISLLGGGFYLLPESAGIMQFTNVQFIDCRASLEQVSNAQGGSLFIDASASNLQVEIYNCTFQKSYSRRDGGVIYVIPSNQKNLMFMENVVISDSYSISYSVLKVSGSNKIQFFAQNFTLQNSYYGFSQYLGLLYQLSQTELSDYSNNYIFSLSGNLILYNATITDYMAGLFQVSNGELELISVSITNFAMASQPLLDLSFMNVIKFQKVVFYNISQVQQIKTVVKICEVSYSSLPLTCDYNQDPPTFIDYDMNQTILTYYGNINIKNIQSVQLSPSSFISIQNIKQTHQITFLNTLFQQIFCQNCQNGLIQMVFSDFYDLGQNIVTLENIEFSLSQCGKISCFSFQQDSTRLLQNNNRILISEQAKSQVIYTIKVFQSIFSHNQGTYGGVFYVNDINIVFNKCKFSSNIASEAGGTIYFISKQATMNIYDSEANNNSAQIGGAFFLSNYTLNSPSGLNLQLRNNVASKFGQNYAEYPNQLTLSLDSGKNFLEKLLLFSNTTTIIDLITIKPYNVSNQQKEYLTLPSGQAINQYKYFDEMSQQFVSFNLTFRIIALNKQENKIENLDGTKCSIFTKRINISDQDLVDAKALDNSTAQSPFTNIDEVFFNTTSEDYNLDEMIIYFDPNSNSQAVLQIDFLCNSVRVPYFSREPPYLMKYQIENYRLRVNVQSFDCQIGEQKRDEDGTCLVCDSKQDQYTVKAGGICQIKDTISTEAVTSASVKLRAGYWRPYTYSTKIEYCLNMPMNCEGGWTPGESSCYTGHIGALCEQCDIYGVRNHGQWSISTQYKCGNCNELGDNTLKVALVSFWTIISIMYSVKSTMETVNNMVLGKKFSKYFIQSPKTGYGGILIKVFTNYLQIIGVVATFQLQLPRALTNVFKAVGSPVESMSYSLDCFLHNLSDINIMYFRMIWALIMPMIYILTFFNLYGLAILVKIVAASKSAIATTFIYLFTFLQPTLLGGFISLLSFRQISNIYWVLGNVAYRYDTDQHIKWVLTFIIPSTFVLALIIPAYMFNSLYEIKNKLDDEPSRKKWGYLYNEYQPKAYFWEIVKIFQKSFIIIFLTFYEDLIIIKAALIFIIVFIYSFLTKKYRPYKLPFLNYLDDVSTLVCGTFIVLGMTLYSANQTDNQEIIWPFYIFLLFINGVFISIIIWEILLEQLEGQVEIFDKIREKINAKFPNLQNANCFFHKLLTIRSQQRKRVKERWRKIREYLFGKTKNNNAKHVEMNSEKHIGHEDISEIFSDARLQSLQVPKYYNQIPPDIQIQAFENDSQIKLSEE